MITNVKSPRFVTPGGSCCSSSAWVSAPGHEHRVDQVHGGIAGLHVAAHNAGTVDGVSVAAFCGGDGAALQRREGADSKIGRGVPGADDVVGQDRGQRLLVGEDLLEGRRCDLREGVVRGGEHGERVGAVEGLGEAGLGG